MPRPNQLFSYLAVSLVLTLAACSQPLSGGAPGGGAPIGAAEPFVMKGRVTDRLGNPLAGVEVFADNTAFYDTNLVGVTDASGGYRIDLSAVAGTWRGGAYVNPRYEGEVYSMRLEADTDAAFAGDAGAVRNFTWKLSGQTPDGDGYYGGTVYLYGDYSVSSFDMAGIELTFTPEGPLVDGNPGETLVLRPDPAYIYDVPVGRYSVSGRYLDPSGAVRPVLLAPDDGSGGFQAVQSAVFTEDALEGPTLELIVQVP